MPSRAVLSIRRESDQSVIAFVASAKVVRWVGMEESADWQWRDWSWERVADIT